MESLFSFSVFKILRLADSLRWTSNCKLNRSDPSRLEVLEEES